MRKIIFLSIILIGLSSSVKSQSSAKNTKNSDDNPYLSLLSMAGNKLLDEVKKRFNLNSGISIKTEETESGKKVNYALETKNRKIKVSGSFTRKQVI